MKRYVFALSLAAATALECVNIIGSSRYLLKAQRTDLHGDPRGSETIRGSFVAPLRERHTSCPG